MHELSYRKKELSENYLFPLGSFRLLTKWYIQNEYATFFILFFIILLIFRKIITIFLQI